MRSNYQRQSLKRRAVKRRGWKEQAYQISEELRWLGLSRGNRKDWLVVFTPFLPFVTNKQHQVAGKLFHYKTSNNKKAITLIPTLGTCKWTPKPNPRCYYESCSDHPNFTFLQNRILPPTLHYTKWYFSYLNQNYWFNSQ